MGNYLDCTYNKSIICENKSECSKCGWNPKVFEKRKIENRIKIAQEQERRKSRRWVFESE